MGNGRWCWKRGGLTLFLTIAFAVMAALAVLPLRLAVAGGGAAQPAASGQDGQASPAGMIVDGREAEELWINTGQGRFRFTVEIADDQTERSRGLMFRQSMPPNHGMLFRFDQPEVITMWMANTPLPLDMVFIDDEGVVRRIVARTVPFSTDTISSLVPLTHVLEINGGMAALIGLKEGDRLEHRFFP